MYTFDEVSGLRAHDIRASLPLEIALYFHGVYCPPFVIVLLILIIYKASELPYPSAALGLETAFIAFYSALEYVRLLLASRGNKTESARTEVAALALAVPVAAFHVYFLAFQTFVLRLDQILNGIALAFVAAEFVFGAAAAATFAHSKRE